MWICLKLKLNSVDLSQEWGSNKFMILIVVKKKKKGIINHNNKLKKNNLLKNKSHNKTHSLL
jgi:hypothetical protein